MEKLFYDADFFKDAEMAISLMRTYECIPQVIFYAKDRKSRFVAGNLAMLEAKNIKHPGNFIGKSDADFHPLLLADEYVKEDRKVIASAKAITNQIWYVMDCQGRPGWYNSSKVPLKNGTGKVIGLAGVRFAVEGPTNRKAQFRKLSKAVAVLEKRNHENVSMAQLAEMVGLSTTHFNRQFAELLGTSPTRMLHAMRIERARYLLTSSDRPISEIATTVGYYDQSHLTRRFKNYCGLTPKAYRKRFKG